MKKDEIIKGIEIIDLALYLSDEKTLVIADLHIGYEDALVKQGILLPKFHFRDIVERTERIFKILEQKKKAVRVIAVNGDLKHEFGTISDEEWRNTLKMIDYLSKRCEKMVLLQGNHDRILGPIAEKRNVLLADHLIVGDKMICHGDKMLDVLPGIRTVIIGHDHPAIGLLYELRKETYKCFLSGKYKNKNLIVQPSLNPITEGTDVAAEKLLSPFLQKDLGNFDVFIVADKVYEFGKLKKIYKQ